ncbi:MAG: hypothetical protein M1827_007067 [Pycnora praestabilis]|nr:MAG: hypothetical protein M1827_007067 [Pycnora praestabilis]
MSPQALHTSLLRPPILHILRAAGFHSIRPSVLDTLVDLCARYILLLASTTAAHAWNNHNDFAPDLTDVRMAMQDCGAFRPQLSVSEEQWRGEEDMRGIEVFLEWVRGNANREIRRVAGKVGETGDVVEVAALGEREDFLTVLKKKHSKTGEESRYQGTVLGKSAEDRIVKIEGGPVESIKAWEAQLQGGSTVDRSPSASKESEAETTATDEVMTEG